MISWTPPSTLCPPSSSSCTLRCPLQWWSSCKGAATACNIRNIKKLLEILSKYYKYFKILYLLALIKYKGVSLRLTWVDREGYRRHRNCHILKKKLLSKVTSDQPQEGFQKGLTTKNVFLDLECLEADSFMVWNEAECPLLGKIGGGQL